MNTFPSTFCCDCGIGIGVIGPMPTTEQKAWLRCQECYELRKAAVVKEAIESLLIDFAEEPVNDT